MTVGRNWLKTLWPASFRGVPFEVERDGEEGGRRIVTHEFPMRDLPFNEDLGAAKRDYDVTAYVAADDVEARADALVAACGARGAALLVLPTHGSILARAVSYKRDREKDRAGKIAFGLRFVREGAPTSLISFASLANLIFVASDGVQAAVASFAAASIRYVSQADFVLQAATGTLAEGAATLEAVRGGANMDPVVSSVQRRAIQALYDAAPEAATRNSGIDGTKFANLVVIARAMADGMEAGEAITAFEPIVSAPVEAPAAALGTPGSRNAAVNESAVSLMIRLAGLTAYAEAIARASIPDRRTAITLRANAAEHFDAAIYAMSAADAELYRAVGTLRGSVIEYLSRAVLDRAPVIAVGSNARMPSLWWAHRLYQDANRSTELVDRNAVAHPSFMPVEFEALAPR